METITTIALVLSAILPITLTIAIIAIMSRIRRLDKALRFKALQIEAELTSAKNELTVKAKELEADVKDTFRNVNHFIEKLPDDPNYKASLEAYVDACTETAHTIEKIGERVSEFPLKKGINAFLEAVKEDEPKATEESVEETSVEEDFAELMAIISDIDELWTTEIHDAMIDVSETLHPYARKAIEASEAVRKLSNMIDVDSDEPAIEDLAISVYNTVTAIWQAYNAATEMGFEIRLSTVYDLQQDLQRSKDLLNRYQAN